MKLAESVICSNSLITGKKINNRPANMAVMCERPANMVDLCSRVIANNSLYLGY